MIDYGTLKYKYAPNINRIICVDLFNLFNIQKLKINLIIINMSILFL